MSSVMFMPVGYGDGDGDGYGNGNGTVSTDRNAVRAE